MSAHFAYTSSEIGDYGVLTADTFTPFALHGLSIEVELRGNCARVHVQYECVNRTCRAARAIAAYALPGQWDLMSCRAAYGGDAVTARPAAAAPLRLSAAAGAALGAAPLAAAAARAGAAQPLPWAVSPGASVLAAAVYHVPLDATRRSGRVRVPLPAELFPAPAAPPAARAAFDAAFDPRRPHALAAGWAIEARGDLFVPLVGPVALAPAVAGGTAEVQYIGDSAFRLRCAAPLARAPVGGFTLECAVRETGEPLRFFVARDEGSALHDADRYAVAMSLAPQLDARRGCEANAEIIFAVDAHSRTNMAAAASAIRTALRSLPSSTRTNVVFASDAKNANGVCVMFPSKTVPVPSAPVEEIAMVVESAALAPRGTSKLFAMLYAAAEQKAPCLCGPVTRGYIRHIILISDSGDATRGPELIAFAERTRRVGNVAFSALALLDGDAADVPLLELLAAEGGGAFCAAHRKDDAVSIALVDVCMRMAVPTLTEVKMVFDEADVRPADGPRLAAISKGTQRIVYCLAPLSLASIGVTVTGRVGETTIEYVGRGNLRDAVLSAASEPGNALSVGLLHLAAAAARVRWLVESAPATGEAQAREVARLSCAFLLLSPATHMQQRRANAPEGTEAGTGSAARVAVRFVPRSATYARTMQLRERERIAGGFVDRRPRPEGAGGPERSDAGRAEAVSRRVALAALVPPPPPREFIRGIVAALIDAVTEPPNSARLGALQHADGSFPLSATLATCVGITLEQLERDVQLVGFGVSEDLTAGRKYVKNHERVWATAVAAAAMERDKSAVNALVYEKALKYMTEHDAEGSLLRYAHDVLTTMGETTNSSILA